ncbi:MAG: hypothetical protein KGY81_03925, partial [Phycisphaerae bacterium]|nr:hypothetical protein [Phycisphaerae bacterium]
GNKPLRLNGANTMGHLQQCVFKEHWDQLRDDILLARIANMNFLRLTQRPVQPDIYDYCDRLGMMVQTDLPLFASLRPAVFAEGAKQAEEMERLVRSHPSNIMVTYINEPFPDDWRMDSLHRSLRRDELEAFFRAADEAVRVANPDRAIKPVDGDYDPPAPGLPDNHCYTGWYNGHMIEFGKLLKGYWQYTKPGWFHACGEWGAEGLDPVELMYRHYPKEWLPEDRDDAWTPAKMIDEQTSNIHYCWFPTQRTIDEWIDASRAFQEWSVRTMGAALRRDPNMVSQAVHLFIDAFPAGWMKAIVDCQRQAKPAYFAYRETFAPLAAQVHTNRRTYFAGDDLAMEFYVCNNTLDVPKGCKLRYQVRRGRNVLFAASVAAKVKANQPTFQGCFNWTTPSDINERTTLNVQLALVDSAGKIIHDAAHDVTVFAPRDELSGVVHVVGTTNGPAWTMVKQLGLSPRQLKASDRPSAIVADDIAAIAKQGATLESAVAGGARLLVTDPVITEDQMDHDEDGQVDTICFAGATFRIAYANMTPRHFANPCTGHPLVEGFDPYDFFFWHESDKDMVQPILGYLMKSTGGTKSVLVSGQGGWGVPVWMPRQAAASYDHGDGQLIVNLVALKDRVETNPVAREYALRCLGM